MSARDQPAIKIADLLSATDWTSFAAGDVAQWPVLLQNIVGTMLENQFPMFVLWGDTLGMVYNDAYAAILDKKHPAALGQPFPLVWSEVWAQVGSIVSSAMQGEPSYFEDLPVYLNRNGWFEQTYFTFSYSPIRDPQGGIPGVLCICHETTSAVNVRERRRSDNDRLNQLFSQAPGFMAVMHGPTHVIEMGNDAYMALIGHRDVIGKTVADALPESVTQGFVDLLDDVFRSGVAFVGKSTRFELPRDTEAAPTVVYVDFVYQPIFDDDKRVIGILLQGHEVTEQTLAREALLLADRQKDQFIATLSHELRNPLAPIRTAAHLLQSPKVTSELIAATTRIIGRQVELMAKLLDDLLDVARISRSQIVIQKAPVALAEVIALAVETVQPQIDAMRHTLILDIQAPVTLDADRVRLTQIVANLLGNAAKYTDPGGTIRVETLVDADQCIIRVSDNGLGIEGSALKSIFKMFSRQSNSLDRADGGLGIGLSLVKSLVELHGGTVIAESAGLGNGSCFSVRLPYRHATKKRTDIIHPAARELR